MKWGPTRVAMGAQILGPLTPRQRMLAVVLIALAIAAGIYRWVVFGNVNTLHGGSAIHTLNGESEVFPTRAEVEEGARPDAKGEGKLRYLSCHEVATYTWNCSLHFVGGQVAVYRGLWNESKRTMGFSVVQHKATIDFKVSIGAPNTTSRSAGVVVGRR